MTLPPSVFADAFRRHAMPKLRALIVDLAGNAEDYGDAMATAIREAHRLGAGYLPDAHHDALIEWIGTAFLDEVALADGITDLIARLAREPSREVLRREVRLFVNAKPEGPNG